ncbi:AAA family ATPase [Sorangium sp. So ce1335]|uniref:AAA family ATPase n=1 Tax=Sorangium sp. So ce1335 TaxID=3133335 RepID=UPI003F61ED9B
MLTSLQLDLFKCFRALRLPLQHFTLLTGLNASGKSTVIQTLTLLHQTAIDTNWGSSLLLDGSILSLGTLGDVVDKVNGRRQFSIGLSGVDFGCTWTFESSSADRQDISVPLSRLVLTEGPREVFRAEHNPASLLPPHPSMARAAVASLLEGLTYICAERTGPRETYPLYDLPRHRTVGPQGDRAPGKLYWHEDYEVPEHLRCKREPAPTLYKQTQAWLADFFPGVSFEVQRVPRANLVTLGIRTSPDTDHHRPQHVGFGITHVLPILVACLHARRGDIILVENPEVHLHPMGQAKIGLFLSMIASAGIQVIVETHSDHVLNGVRRAVRTSLLPPENVAIHFFQPRSAAEAQGEAQVISPSMDREGNIDHWPQGFFDQFEKDMNYFAGFGP